MKKVEVRIELLLDFLDQYEGGKLYPELDEEDTILRININPITVEFTLGKKGEGNDRHNS